MTNLLADFAVRFNASTKKHAEFFYVPCTNTNTRVIELLYKYRSINTFSFELCPQKKFFRIKIVPIYTLSEPLIRSIELVSKPGRRVCWTAAELAINFAKDNFQGFYVVSTSRGVCSSNELILSEALGRPISGEILLKINL